MWTPDKSDQFFMNRNVLKSHNYGTLGMRLIIVLVSILVCAGCSMEASIAALTESLPEIFQAKLITRNTTPGSQQHVITSGGYRVQGSMDFYRGAGQVTTSSGYKVQTNIQSTLFRAVQ